jgi:hypothetical protein
MPSIEDINKQIAALESEIAQTGTPFVQRAREFLGEPAPFGLPGTRATTGAAGLGLLTSPTLRQPFVNIAQGIGAGLQQVGPVLGPAALLAGGLRAGGIPFREQPGAVLEQVKKPFREAPTAAGVGAGVGALLAPQMAIPAALLGSQLAQPAFESIIRPAGERIGRIASGAGRAIGALPGTVGEFLGGLPKTIGGVFRGKPTTAGVEGERRPRKPISASELLATLQAIEQIGRPEQAPIVIQQPSPQFTQPTGSELDRMLMYINFGI